MTRLYADMLSRVTVFITVVLSLGGCVAPNPQVTALTPQVIIQADIPGREVIQPIELDNCDGKADAKRTEHRTRSVESTISAEAAAKFGVSAEVLSAEVQATVGASVGWTEGQGTSIELVAPPGTRMAFQLVWIGNEQVGIVQNLRGSNIPIAFRIFKPTDVRIKSQYDIGCPTPNPQSIQPIPAAQQPVASPTHSIQQFVTPSGNSQPPSAYRDKGFLYHQSGQYNEAIATFKICIELYPSFGDCYHGLGMAYREIGDFQQALPNHDKAIALSPRFDYLFERGVTYHQKTDYDRAISDFKACLDKNPGFGNCAVRLGMVYRDMGNFQEALSYHNIAIALDPSRADFYWERGITYERMGNRVQAEADKRKARDMGYKQ